MDFIFFLGTSNVTHTEEGNYIWQRNNPTEYSEIDQIVHRRLVKIWLNFVTNQYVLLHFLQIHVVASL